VLIAEADPWVRDMLTELVLSVRCDAQLKSCANGQEAAEWLGMNQPDLVIAAWELPSINGLNLLRSVRAKRSQPAVPFILLTSRSDSASVREVLPLAPTAYLTKPLNMDGLRVRLERVLESAEQVSCAIAPLSPGLTLKPFLESRRDLADGGPLLVDVANAVKLSQGASGVDVTMLEQQLCTDPNIAAVLIAAANSAAHHLGDPVQTLGDALAMLGATQAANLVSGLALKRGAVLTDERLLVHAHGFWGVSRRTAEYAASLAGVLDLDQDRCYYAGLLYRLGDLAVVRCLQDWVTAGGELDEALISQALEQYSAAFGSALRTRWRLPIGLRELIAGAYAIGGGVRTHESLALNVASQLADLTDEEGVEKIARSKPARLLKIDVEALETLRGKPQTSTI
jgi:HD-like signal output (HDOD) protein/ActR/RegA family two-component response regulator